MIQIEFAINEPASLLDHNDDLFRKLIDFFESKTFSVNYTPGAGMIVELTEFLGDSFTEDEKNSLDEWLCTVDQVIMLPNRLILNVVFE